MADHTHIEWTDATLNPIRARDPVTGKTGWHCEHVTPGCENCYAETMNAWRGTGHKFIRQNRPLIEPFLDERMLRTVLTWKRPRRIFWNSMTDTFADFVQDEWIDKQFAVAALTPQHTHLFLTKRAERMREHLADAARCGDQWCWHAGRILGDRDPGESPGWPLPNVWLGVSVEDQARADDRIPFLLDTPAAVRFISAEPLLGPIALRETLTAAGDGDWLASGKSGERRGIDWVIAGGESGPGARPMHPDWARSLRDQCQAAGVPFFFKQWGEFAPVINGDGTLRSEGAGTIGAWRSSSSWRFLDRGEGHAEVWRVGKKTAGRLLDGREWSEFPV